MSIQRGTNGFEHRLHPDPDATIRIDHLCLSERDRLVAEAYLRKAETMAEFIQLAARKLRSAAALLALSGSRPAPLSSRSPRRA